MELMPLDSWLVWRINARLSLSREDDGHERDLSAAFEKGSCSQSWVREGGREREHPTLQDADI